jgi:diguanylate cyclase (GGDEF)-like protein
MAFMVVDIDFFKQVNDQYGHPTGDGVLRSFAKICQESIRSCDSIGRIGGEEFGIFLPSTTTNDALEVAERIRKENLTFPVDNENNKTITLTVSIGLARLLDTDESISDVYVRADAALYQAKQNGRNRTVTCKLGLDDSG